MKAITYDRYTGPDGLSLSDIDKPTPGADQVLIRVGAAALNAYDWHMYRGEPTFMRLQTGLKLKQQRVLGADVAGTVEAVGADVTGLKKGDRVLAEIGQGACAEYAVAGADAVAKIAKGVSFESAAAAPMAALTALQALRDTAALQPGERVLVWGASGGVGHIAIQIAKLLGAGEVHAVCSGKNAAMARAQGADRVFDYASGDLPAAPEKYDVVFDTVSTQPLAALKPILSSSGRVVIVGAVGGGKLLGPVTPMIGRMLGSKFRRMKVLSMVAKVNRQDFETIASWLADGSLTPVVQETYALADTASACHELEAGHVAGKLVITP